MYDNGRVKVNPLGALLSLALGMCLAVLAMGYAVGVQATNLDRFREAADTALVQTSVLSAEHAERLAQETIGYLTGRRAGWLEGGDHRRGRSSPCPSRSPGIWRRCSSGSNACRT